MNADQWGAFLPILVIVLAFWFLIVRPARKRQVQARQLQHGIAVGEEVMLTSGIFGRVAGLADETLELEIAPGVVVTAHRQAVARIVEPADEGGDGRGGDTDDDQQRAVADRRPDGGDAPA